MGNPRQDARKRLAEHGYTAVRVLLVESPGDSQTGCEVICFVDDRKVARTAYVIRDGLTETMDVMDGWPV